MIILAGSDILEAFNTSDLDVWDCRRVRKRVVCVLGCWWVKKDVSVSTPHGEIFSFVNGLGRKATTTCTRCKIRIKKVIVFMFRKSIHFEVVRLWAKAMWRTDAGDWWTSQ
jgi:hypothetical protein